MALDDEKMKEMIRQFALQKEEEEDKDEAFGSSLHGPALWRYVDSKPKDRLPRRKRAAVRTFGPAVDRARVSTFVVPGGCFMCDKLNDCIVRDQGFSEIANQSYCQQYFRCSKARQSFFRFFLRSNILAAIVRLRCSRASPG